MTSSRWSRCVTVRAVLLLASIAAVVSYSHMYELALRHGEPGWRVALFPLSVDGMIVASSMTLLDAARSGQRGGWLPWSLLVVGSLASLAANVAVAEQDLWSQMIHAWPSFAPACAYELLMRQFRASVRGVRDEDAAGTQTQSDEQAEALEGPDRLGLVEQSASSVADAFDASQPWLRVVGESGAAKVEEADQGDLTLVGVPRVQVEAWRWALANRCPDGKLPTGKEIAERFDHRPRWGRLIKQWGQEGRFDTLARSR